MSELIDETEKILQIWVHQCKPRALWWQITQLLFNHQFVVLETTKWWWSMEKDDARILIQRSKQLEDVRDFVDTIKHRQHFMKDRRTPMCRCVLRLVAIVRIVRTVQIMILAGVVSFGCCSYVVSLRF